MVLRNPLKFFIWMVPAIAVAVVCPPRASFAGQVAAVESPQEQQVDPRTWPEIPIPPQPPEGSYNPHQKKFPDLNQRWLMQVGAGWQHNISPQKAFFTDMVQLNFTVGKPLTEHLVPFVACDLGFGGLQENLEQMTGEGRSTAFGFTMGMLGSANFSQRHRGYVSVAGGYFLRSMVWGEIYHDPETGQTSGSKSITMGDWGLSLRTGILFQLSHGTKTRFVDLGMGVQVSPADELLFQDGTSTLAGSNEDAWLTITLRFWDTL